jgi:hypothetical protein
MNTEELYEQRDRAASNSYTLHHVAVDRKWQTEVSSLRNDFVGNLTFKRSKSGMRTTCYLHLYGFAIVKGIANGCNYDTQTAAFQDAWSHWLAQYSTADSSDKEFLAQTHPTLVPDISTAVGAFTSGGARWKDALEVYAHVLAAHIGG